MGHENQEFRELVERWRRETGGYSTIARMVAHPSYQSIIEMGKPALPFILRELRDQPDYWFYALWSIAGVDPVRANATFDQAVEDWLQWGESEGLLG